MSSGLTWSERANWGLLIGGAIMSACSLGFFVIAALQPELRVSFIITGVLMLGGGVLMLVLGWGNDEMGEDDRRIRSIGMHGTASVFAFRPTGEVVKKRPRMELQLRLSIPSKPPYLVTRKELVPKEKVDLLRPGMPLVVFYDPDDPLRIVIDWDGETPRGWAGTSWEPTS